MISFTESPIFTRLVYNCLMKMNIQNCKESWLFILNLGILYQKAGDCTNCVGNFGDVKSGARMPDNLLLEKQAE